MTRPNIIWLTLESTRYDHTTLGNYDRDTTPQLSELASRERGVSVDTAFSHSTWTLPSTASILTGTAPSYHGTGIRHDSLPNVVPTVAELLGDVGYATAGLTTNPHLSVEHGTGRGFDRLDRLSKSNLKHPRYWTTVLKYLLRIRTYGGGLTTDTARHGRNYMMNDVLRRWIRSLDRDEAPFFLYAHYGDPHHPYTPPLSFLDRFLDGCQLSPREALELSVRVHDDLYEVVADGCPLSDDEWDALVALYDAEIAFADYCVGRLVEYVDRRVDDETLVVVTADHGELFGEYGLLSHKLVLDDALTRVPLVLYGSGVDDLTHQADELVQHADVMRTALELAGADTSSLQGIDLREETREFVVCQRGESSARKNVEAFRSHNPDFDGSRFVVSLLSALRTDDWKYESGDDHAALYDLPDEETDTADANPEVAARLDDALTTWLETTGSPASSDRHDAELTREMEQQLENMGYL